MNKFYKFLDRYPFFALIVNFLVVLGFASVVPLLLFGVFALFFIAIGGFPLWIWLIPLIGSILWYAYFFLMGID